MSDHVCQEEFDFTLVLGGVSEITEEMERALFESGCDDATLSARSGRLYVTFSRMAASYKDAVISAIKDVRRSNIGATVLRVDQCDLITQSEIARRIGRSRQLVNQYITGDRGPGLFPPPACNITEKVPLWYWCEVAYWLESNNLIKEEELREAQDITVINSVLELEHQKLVAPDLTKDIMRELCLC